MPRRRDHASIFLGWLLILGCSAEPTTQQIVLLQTGDVAARRAAAQSLGAMRNPQAAAALAEAIGDQDAVVRRYAIQSLAAQQSLTHLPQLEQALDDRELAVRLAAAWALVELDPDNANYAPVLVAALRAGEGGVFIQVGALGAQADWAVPTLTTLLADPEPGIRALAARTLGQIGPAAADAKPALTRAARDGHDAVRTAASEALTKIAP